jgi:signal transduction histidine kinase
LFFDDRLATVLRQRATGEANLRTQFRQLLDLLGKDRAGTAPGSDRSLLAAAWLRMEALSEAIPAATRARLIREPGWRFRNPDLASHFADHEPEVAAAALARAELTVEEWTALIPRLPVRARGFLRLRRDLPLDVEALLTRLGVHDRGLPAPAEPPPSADAPVHASPPAADGSAAAPAPSPAAIPLRPVPTAPSPAPAPPQGWQNAGQEPGSDDSGRTEISALVERIAQFRRERGEGAPDLESSPRLPLGELPERVTRPVASFGFCADTAGRIAWAAAEVAPMVIGTRLFAAAGSSDDALARAFARRQPIQRAAVSLAGAPAIAGDWIVDAEPRFTEEGHFSGYLGRFRRPLETAGPGSAEAREADRIRQLLHELRTPVTAVQGYAEVIQQQLFGPAPHEYRALAAAIAADAARILAGFEELDRLARLETGALTIAAGESDLAALVRRTAAQLGSALGPQDAGLTLAFPEAPSLIVAIDPEDAEALVWRLLASLAGVCAPGERITVSLHPLIGAGAAVVRMSAALPARLAAEDNVFAATIRSAQGTINAGLFGTGFALRLARAEARAMGGELRRVGAALELTLPLLSDSAVLPGALGG